MKRTMPNSNPRLALCRVAILACVAVFAAPGAASAAPVLDAQLHRENHEMQVIEDLASGGQYRLGFAGDVTGDLPAGAGPAQIAAALNALPSVNAGGGSVSVGSTAGGDVVRFGGGPLADTDVPMLTVEEGSIPLTGPSRVSVKPYFPVGVHQGDAVMTYRLTIRNTGDAPISGNTKVLFTIPPGVQMGTGGAVGTRTGGFGSNFALTGWFCQATLAVCESTNTPAPGGSFDDLWIDLWLEQGATAPVLSTSATVFGGGAVSDVLLQDGISVGPGFPFGITDLTAGAFDADYVDSTVAGGHPFQAESSFRLQNYRNLSGYAYPNESTRRLFFDLPAGFIGNPEAVDVECTIAQVQALQCPETAAVGGIYPWLVGRLQEQVSTLVPLYRVVAEPGFPASFAFRPIQVSGVTYILRPKLRSNGDYGVTVEAPLPPENFALLGVKSAKLCNFGAEIVGLDFPRFDGCKTASALDAFQTPFLTNPTECAEPVAKLTLDSYENPGTLTADGFADTSDPRWRTRSVTSPLITDCAGVPFEPSMAIAPTSTGRDSASGLGVDLTVPQDGLVDPDGRATAHLKKTVVELPEGLVVNPSAATGLEACSDAQMAMERLTAPGCPEASKLGTVMVTSPLVDQPLSGHMYLGEPKSTDPASGEMLRLWVAVRNDELGLSAKLPGSTVADPQTGRLTATFDNNPRVPFDRLEVDLKGGQRGVLATPRDCGIASVRSTLSSWAGNVPVVGDTGTAIGGDCGERFNPTLAAGNSDNRGRGQGGTYSFKFSRQDGEQYLRGLTATLPTGLLASVKGLPLCKDANAAAGTCPAGSKIGIVDAAAGSGDPFVLEEKGEVFLTQGYKGGEYGLAVKVRAIAGPFRGAMELSPIIVRQAIHVDRKTAQVTAVSDPFPQVWHGVPLRVREVTVLVNRDKFMVNPSDCEAKTVQAAITSTEGTVANLSNPFQASGCAALPFKPKLTMRLTGRKQTRTGKHPGIKAQVTQTGIGEAGIERAEVRLPKSLALDPDNAQALCEFADGTKPDLESHCPKGSIVGKAKATTPLLDKPLAGNVYFVKNIRIDEKTGNQIRTLPMIIVALRGEIAINLVGESSTTRAGKLVNTFDEVPDAPVSQFNLNIKGGKNGILAVTRTRKAKINLCAGRHVAEADMDGQNGRRHDTNIRMKTPCTKKQTRKAKRAAKKAAQRARAARRG